MFVQLCLSQPNVETVLIVFIDVQVILWVPYLLTKTEAFLKKSSISLDVVIIDFLLSTFLFCPILLSLVSILFLTTRSIKNS